MADGESAATGKSCSVHAASMHLLPSPEPASAGIPFAASSLLAASHPLYHDRLSRCLPTLLHAPLHASCAQPRTHQQAIPAFVCAQLLVSWQLLTGEPPTAKSPRSRPPNLSLSLASPSCGSLSSANHHTVCPLPRNSQHRHSSSHPSWTAATVLSPALCLAPALHLRHLARLLLT